MLTFFNSRQGVIRAIWWSSDTQGYVEVQVNKGKATLAKINGLDEGEEVSYWLSFDRN